MTAMIRANLSLGSWIGRSSRTVLYRPFRLPGSFKASAGDRPERFRPLAGRRLDFGLYRAPGNAGAGLPLCALLDRT